MFYHLGKQNVYRLKEDDINIVYCAYDGPESSAYNTNNALDHASGDFIHILNHDDFLYHENAIRDMVNTLTGSDKLWVASACLHTDDNETKLERLHIPSWPGEKAMIEAVNRNGCPSVVMFPSSITERFDTDEQINYAMDCDFYIRLARELGAPAILREPAVVIRMWEGQLTNQMNVPMQIEFGKQYMRRKYE